jgi:ABC-2 type transport system permease protein
MDTDWYWRDIVARGLLSVAPGSWFGFFHADSNMSSGPDNINAMALVGQSWRVLGSANIWIGAVAGSAMIFAAMRLRRWRDEG